MDVLNIVLKSCGIFAIGFATVYALANLWHQHKVKKRKRQQSASAQRKKPQTEEKTSRFRLNKMDVILIIIAVGLVIFTLKMIALFEEHMAVPDTLITCVFAVCGGECGAMSWIKTSKEKYQDRQWQLEDEQRMEAAAKKTAQQDFEPAFDAEQRNRNQ